MKTLSTKFIFIVFALLTTLFAAPGTVWADTYTIYDLGSDQGRFFYGMDDLGNAYMYDPGVYPGTYRSFFNGVLGAASSNIPSLIPDNGTPCTPTVPAGGRVLHGVCNNGLEAFTGYLSAGLYRPGVYLGSNPAVLLAGGGEGLIYMNGLGDVVFNDDFSDRFYEAVDLNTAPVPEPGSILLLATGGLTLLGGAVRRTRRTEHRA